ncbi:unnamed protein product [Schistosoma margrebowiei]|uniref:Uncharacterized protein n=1 Tax=Schistosoma margrebowiei TaxID=48269 RepID=A0A183N130_9TREM|nr:unnamed protein product [Schistosoma margrebowiei]
MWSVRLVYKPSMFQINEAGIGVLDITGWARRKAGLIRTLDWSDGSYASLVRSIIYCCLIGGIVTLYLNRAHRPQVITIT